MHSQVHPGVQVKIQACHEKLGTLHMPEFCTGGPASIVRRPFTAEEAAALNNNIGHWLLHSALTGIVATALVATW